MRCFPLLRIRLSLLTATIAVAPRLAGAQTTDQAKPGETVTVTAGPQYGAGWLHRFFLGTHYRPLWTTPIEAQVLDMETFAGGLQVSKRGGGEQTKSLRFKAADGHEYQFRSIDKDASKSLPPALQETAARDVVRDQASAGHPGAPVVVPPILSAVGVLHSEPQYVVLPKDDPRLGEFAEEFGGMFGTIEERPTDGKGDAEGFAGASDVVDSDELLKLIEDTPDNQVDTRAFLTARLVDLFLGDWDRHRDQWRWARFGDERPRRWQPIPRDRDQAFVRFDGLLLTVARSSAPQLVKFGPDYPGMLGLTWNGRDLDRRLLVGLELSVYDSIAADLKSKLTDEVIEAAVSEMPPPYIKEDSAKLASALKQRRDKLPEAARHFYGHLAGEVEVHGTDVDEVAVAERIDDRFTQVTLARLGKDGRPAELYYSRRFDREETHEVRLFLHSGNDRAIVRGPGDGGVNVRVISGKGTDEVADSSAGGSVSLYSTDGDQVLAGREVSADRKPYQPDEPAVRDWGGRWLSQVWFDAGPDIGVFLGTGAGYTRYGFRHDPYAARYRLRAGWATGAGTGRVDFSALWHRANSLVAAGVYARASGIDVLRYNGFGNEVEAEGDEEFYRVKQVDLTLIPYLSVPVAPLTTLRFGPRLRYSDTDFDVDRFISQERPYGSGAFGVVGVTADLRFDARDRPNATTHGVLLALGGSLYPSVWDVEESFGELHAEASTFMTADSMALQPTLALRLGGKRVWGQFPYQEAAYIGDDSSVRLGRQNRYGGEASVYANAELRLFLARFYALVPGEFGVFGLGDVGRVYFDGESSDKWHAAAGGGVWASFLERANTVSLAVASSSVRTAIYFSVGFGF